MPTAGSPRHIVLFPDGNRRWAEKNGLEIADGHKRGFANLLRFYEWCRDRGVEALTVFGFSTENWNRSDQEVGSLMALLKAAATENIRHPDFPQVRVRVIGDRDKLSEEMRRIVAGIEETTRDHSGMQLTFGIGYGGQWDLTQAVRRIVESGYKPEEVTEELIEKHLSTAGLPQPDFVIRAGGEVRLSNFLLWQCAYSELYFSSALWPDFSEADLEESFVEYNRRQRRFGQ